MKSNSLTVSVHDSRRIQVSNPFTWTNVQKFINSLNCSFLPCKTINDAKFYAGTVLFGLLFGCFLYTLPFILYVFG